MENTITLNGTKAETLEGLKKMGFPIPKTLYFEVKRWEKETQDVLREIQNFFQEDLLAVRSSTKAEDTAHTSMAGAFESLLNVNCKSNDDLSAAILKVIASYDGLKENQVLVQPMVQRVAVSGVLMTQVLDDGSPYYVINYDDSTGLTDTVTSGTTINKTVYIYNGAAERDFDSPYLSALFKEVVWKLEEAFPQIPLDVEFAIDKDMCVHLLQVRRITTIKRWKNDINNLVSERIEYLGDYVDSLMKQRRGIAGNKTLLGIMPDWNPAEMIGVVPHPLAMSLYRELITKSTWRIARQEMGYKLMPNVELMVSLFGRTFIDVRNSINSFLPQGLGAEIESKIVNGYIKRLETHPHLHDKIEFEIVHTCYDFNFENVFNERYPDILKREEFLLYRGLLRSLTKNAIINDPTSSLNQALQKIEKLKSIQNDWEVCSDDEPFNLSDRINTLLGECIELGTLPFSLIARHGFIAESLLRSAVAKNAITEERAKFFRRSVKTIAGEMSEDFYKVCNGLMERNSFLKLYGHLRPSSYDLLSPNYENREDLFEGEPHQPVETDSFTLTEKERADITELLAEIGFDSISAEDMFVHAEKAIVGREYAKFIFTKHLSHILELIAKWGRTQGFGREEMAMLTLNDILSILFAPLTKDVKSFYQDKIAKAKVAYDVACSFKLSYLIRSKSDIFIVPQQRSTPNFIGSQRIEREIVLLNPYVKEVPELKDKIVCIEGADPGYDWIFSRDIAGLITKYGGANSHMAIRCSEYNLPAAIGCGEQPFDRIVEAGKCLLDCQGKRLEPLSILL